MSTELNINDFEALKAWKDKKWVVITPTGQSELGDILFETTPYDLALQMFGGLEKRRVFKILDSREEAATIAQLLIDVQTGVAQEAIKQMKSGLVDAHKYLTARNLGEPAEVLVRKLEQILLVIDSRN
jgi:hypothetical protein